MLGCLLGALGIEGHLPLAPGAALAEIVVADFAAGGVALCEAD